ncbi:MAG: hypothetical protein V4691_07350 [Pseudomonadota bacterium]
MMNFATPLIVAAVWMFLFRKMPSWSWFPPLLERFPTPLRNLWSGWVDCAFCGGFWVALILRWVTGLHLLIFPLETLPIIEWLLDALAAGLAALFIIRVLDALKAVAGSH